MSQKTDPRTAYLAGVVDGFRLSRAATLDEAEKLIAAIREGDVDARIRAALASPDTLDDTTETAGLDPTKWLN